MISYISGKVIHKSNNYIIVEVNGLGYKILVTPDILENSQVGQNLQLYTYLKISENEQTLFGLPDTKTLDFFELLITVTGVGPKMALTILSSAKADILETAISSQDADIFTRMSGVGKKTAERIILELKTKVNTLAIEASDRGSDTYDALVSLGYSIREARETLNKIDHSLSSEEQLKQALKILAK